MTKNDSPDAIVFDIGMVLVNVEFGRLYDFLRSKGIRQASQDELANALHYELYETGKLTDNEFYLRVLELTSEPFSFADWRSAWTGILTPCKEMLLLADRLAARHAVFILSNTNPLHFEHMERELGLRRRFKRVVTSCDAGVMKPDAEIYAFAERQFGMRGTQLLFFDDREENVVAARDAGWHAHVFESRRAALSVLADAGFA